MRLTDRLHMAIVVDWDSKQQNKTNKQNSFTHLTLFSVIWLTDHRHIAIIVDWDLTKQNEQRNKTNSHI